MDASDIFRFGIGLVTVLKLVFWTFPLHVSKPRISFPMIYKAGPNHSLHQETFAVFIDGGVRRGGDIFKAVALGAQAGYSQFQLARVAGRAIAWLGRLGGDFRTTVA